MRFLPFAIVLICVAGCSSRVTKESSGQNTTLDAKQAYLSILENLNPEFPGRGTDVYNDPLAVGVVTIAILCPMLWYGENTNHRK